MENSLGHASSMLSAARSSIGSAHRFLASTSIQTTVVSIDHRNEYMFTTFGLEAILAAFKEAAYAYTHTGGYSEYDSRSKIAVAWRAKAFIQGTGLEIALRTYNLDYDADHLRSTFFRIFHVKATS